MPLKRYKKSQKGIITIPFLLVLMIILFLILSLLGVAMTLVHVSVSQYMSYSTARKLSLSAENKDKQKELARDHYNKLRGQFFSDGTYTGKAGDWFTITDNMPDKNLEFFWGDDVGDPNKRNMFYGAKVDFTTKILKLQIPGLMGSSGKNPNKVEVNSFLGREPSVEECQDFNKSRGTAIKDSESFRGFGEYKSTLVSEEEGDNGC